MAANIKTFEGDLNASGLKFALVAARFNDFFVSHLVDGAVDTIVRHGGSAENIDLAWVPGSYEIPFAVKKMLNSGKYDAVIAMGVVIQGATPHAGYINNEVAKSLAQWNEWVPLSTVMKFIGSMRQSLMRLESLSRIPTMT